MTTLYASGATWNTVSHWGTTSGASDGTVPTSSDDVIFDAASVSMALDLDATVDSISATGYTQNFHQQQYSLSTVGDFIAASGTFIGGSATLTIGGDFLLSGAAFTAPSGTMIIEGSFDRTSGTFLHNNGIVSFSGVGGTHSITQDTVTFYDSNINKTGSPVFTVTGVMIVENDFSIEESGATIVTINGTETLAVGKDVTMGTVPFGGTIPILMRGTGNFAPSPTWTNTGTVIITDETYPLFGPFAILREDGFNRLREDGYRILREGT